MFMTMLKEIAMILKDNWVSIIIIIAVGVTAYRSGKEFLSKDADERVESIKRVLSKTMLKLVTDAENDYKDWVKAGAIKRSEVIAKIFDKYPILESVTDQVALIAWIDDAINNALDTLRKILEKNRENKEIENDTTVTEGDA